MPTVNTVSAFLLDSKYVYVFAAVVSGAVSLIVAWLTSSRTFRIEANKLRLATQQLAFEKLLEARILAYPRLFRLLSDLPKAIEKNPTVTIDLIELRRNVNLWDSEYSIFLGKDAANACFDFRLCLSELVLQRTPAPNLDKAAGIDDHLLELAEKLELALRGDLGIHGIAIHRNDLITRRQKRYRKP